SRNPVTATPLQSVVYEVLGTDTNGCENTAFADVFVFQPPPEIIWDTTIVIGEIVNLDAFAGEGYDYIWDPDMWLSCDTCAQVTSIPLEDIEYTVTVTDSLGCFSVVSYYTIEVLPVSSIDVPDAFTPNGDGVNDIIYVDGWGIKELLEFKIYNRWGELVFETSNLEEGWDGYYKEELQNVETYAYVVVAMTYIDPDPVTKKGYINLLR
ncbi:MAG: gliding motility-associated C-terminal domain-containing protein, partial [Flavobacteriales bacterium]|nr:gliding motility-associated C-terminal domain-containing protein [Flavobacteriales bacterium]